jgi:hypothetical protein
MYVYRYGECPKFEEASESWLKGGIALAILFCLALWITIVPGMHYKTTLGSVKYVTCQSPYLSQTSMVLFCCSFLLAMASILVLYQRGTTHKRWKMYRNCSTLQINLVFALAMDLVSNSNVLWMNIVPSVILFSCALMVLFMVLTNFGKDKIASENQASTLSEISSQLHVPASLLQDSVTAVRFNM